MAAEPINDPDTPADPRAADRRRRSLLHAALLAVNAGYFVFPVRPGGKEPALDKDWEGQATRDRVVVRRWWRRTLPPHNIGIATGPSGVVVVDLDDSHGATAPEPFAGARNGQEVLTRLAARAGAEVPTDTFTVLTPSGGQHLYFRAPPEVELRNTAGMLGWRIDTRARGGYVVGAGSIRAGGPLPGRQARAAAGASGLAAAGADPAATPASGVPVAAPPRPGPGLRAGDRGGRGRAGRGGADRDPAHHLAAGGAQAGQPRRQRRAGRADRPLGAGRGRRRAHRRGRLHRARGQPDHHRRAGVRAGEAPDTAAEPLTAGLPRGQLEVLMIRGDRAHLAGRHPVGPRRPAPARAPSDEPGPVRGRAGEPSPPSDTGRRPHPPGGARTPPGPGWRAEAAPQPTGSEQKRSRARPDARTIRPRSARGSPARVGRPGCYCGSWRTECTVLALVPRHVRWGGRVGWGRCPSGGARCEVGAFRVRVAVEVAGLGARVAGVVAARACGGRRRRNAQGQHSRRRQARRGTRPTRPGEIAPRSPSPAGGRASDHTGTGQPEPPPRPFGPSDGRAEAAPRSPSTDHRRPS